VKLFRRPKNLSILAISSFLTLNGCAITEKDANKMTSYDLCKVIYDHRSNANSRPVASKEIQSRGYDCSKDRDAILSSISIELQSAAALMGVGSQLLIQSQPAPPTIVNQPAPTNCRIIRGQYGDRMYCN